MDIYFSSLVLTGHSRIFRLKLHIVLLDFADVIIDRGPV